MGQPLRGEERVRSNAERGVMMEASPAPAFEVIQPQLVLELLIVTLDPVVCENSAQGYATSR
jgi:hypothetical protein